MSAIKSEGQAKKNAVEECTPDAAAAIDVLLKMDGEAWERAAPLLEPLLAKCCEPVLVRLSKGVPSSSAFAEPLAKQLLIKSACGPSAQSYAFGVVAAADASGNTASKMVDTVLGLHRFKGSLSLEAFKESRSQHWRREASTIQKAAEKAAIKSAQEAAMRLEVLHTLVERYLSRRRDLADKMIARAAGLPRLMALAVVTEAEQKMRRSSSPALWACPNHQAWGSLCKKCSANVSGLLFISIQAWIVASALGDMGAVEAARRLTDAIPRRALTMTFASYAQGPGMQRVAAIPAMPSFQGFAQPATCVLKYGALAAAASVSDAYATAVASAMDDDEPPSAPAAGCAIAPAAGSALVQWVAAFMPAPRREAARAAMEQDDLDDLDVLCAMSEAELRQQVRHASPHCCMPALPKPCCHLGLYVPRGHRSLPAATLHPP
eukprot:491961-Prymnesium_polylepis.2